jgi:hypothetical protein
LSVVRKPLGEPASGIFRVSAADEDHVVGDLRHCHSPPLGKGPDLDRAHDFPTRYETRQSRSLRTLDLVATDKPHHLIDQAVERSAGVVVLQHLHFGTSRPSGGVHPIASGARRASLARDERVDRIPRRTVHWWIDAP